MRIISEILTLLKSIYICLKVLPFRQAIHCPIIIDSSVVIKTKLKKGSIIIDNDRVDFKMIKIGRGDGSFQMAYKSFSTLNIRQNSNLVFRGEASLSKGFKLMISSGGTVVLGSNVHLGSFAMISSNTEIIINDNVGTGWNLTILDWDGHNIVDINTKSVINRPKPIVIGKNSWIGSHVTIMKGVSLAENTIVPYGSIITKSCSTPFSIFGGMPNRVLKSEVAREDKLIENE